MPEEEKDFRRVAVLSVPSPKGEPDDGSIAEFQVHLGATSLVLEATASSRSAIWNEPRHPSDKKAVRRKDRGCSVQTVLDRLDYDHVASINIGRVVEEYAGAPG